MKIKLLLLSILFPLVSFGATNVFDSVLINKSLRFTAGGTVQGGMVWTNGNLTLQNGATTIGATTWLSGTAAFIDVLNTTLYGSTGLDNLNWHAKTLTGTWTANNAFLVNGNTTLGNAAGDLITVVGAATFTNQTKHLGGIRGVPGATAATAGNIGEYLQVLMPQASGVALTTVTPKTIMSMTLTAGTWIINGQMEFNPAASTTFREILAGWTTTTNSTATMTQNARIDMGFPVGYSLGGYASAQSVPTYHFTCSGTTNLYFNAYADFATSTMTAYGFMTALRSANAQ